jgi:hypothetical protein
MGKFNLRKKLDIVLLGIMVDDLAHLKERKVLDSLACYGNNMLARAVDLPSLRSVRSGRLSL